MNYQDYLQMPTWWLKAELSELSENGITNTQEVKDMKKVLNERYPID